LWVWWGTIPSDFKFLLLLPFAIGGTALLSDVLQQVLADRGWRLLSPRGDERAARRSSSAAQAAVRLGSHPPRVDARQRHPPAGDGGATAARATPVR
jgi:hypothetical protein